MRLARSGGMAALALVVFGAVLALTFPTDALVRSLLARLLPPGGPALDFARASLRPRGLRLEQVTLRRPDGRALASLDWLRLRPSLLGLVSDHTGRPWRVALGACGGTVEATLAAEDGADVARIAWRQVDLGNCPPLGMTGEAIAGLAEGSATLRRVPARPLAGDGTVTIRGAAWRAAGRVPGLDVLHADPALVRWRLAEGRLVLDGIDLHGPELAASGSGTLRLARALGDSALDFRLALLPGPATPPRVQDLLGLLPPSTAIPGARTLTLSGTLVAPRLGPAR